MNGAEFLWGAGGLPPRFLWVVIYNTACFFCQVRPNLHVLAVLEQAKENVKASSAIDSLVIDRGFLDGKAKIKRYETMKHVYEFFPRLEERRKQMAGTLSGGEQQMVAVGRGLMSLPKLMMFDEPSLGLAPILVQDIFSMIKRINEEGVTVLLVEQNVTQTLKMCHRAYALENGRIVIEGSGEDLMNDEHVREAYLGI